MIRVVVSSCLLGSPVRYDGGDKKSEHPVLRRWLDEGRVVSACPEMLGGLGTPRPPAEIVGAQGVTAALLRERGIAVFSEEELDAAAQYVEQLETRRRFPSGRRRCTTRRAAPAAPGRSRTRLPRSTRRSRDRECRPVR